MNRTSNKFCKLTEKCHFVDCDACERVKKTLRSLCCERCEMNGKYYPEVLCFNGSEPENCDLCKDVAESAFFDVLKELM